jgi:galactokinase
MNMDNEQRKSYISEEFIKLYGVKPEVWVQAPGRVDLMGSHTDYNLGYVLTQAIDRNTWIAARPRSDSGIRIHSLNLPGSGEFDLEHIFYDESSHWSNYVRGVASELKHEGYALVGFDGLIHSTIPFGSGLSSSAALEVSTACLLANLGNLTIDRVELALLCQRAENEFVGMNCGILDQYTSLMGLAGQVLLLDCRSVTHQMKPVTEDIQVVICDTRAKRELTGSEYADRRSQCELGVEILSSYYPDINALRDISLGQLEEHEDELPQIIAMRSRFIIEENQRVLDLAEALSAGNRAEIRKLAYESYLGARGKYEIVSAEMEFMMEAMMSGHGIIGARQAGAGFGGCMVSFVDHDSVDNFVDHVVQVYKATTSITPHVYPVVAAQGAGLLWDNIVKEVRK